MFQILPEVVEPRVLGSQNEYVLYLVEFLKDFHCFLVDNQLVEMISL